MDREDRKRSRAGATDDNSSGVPSDVPKKRRLKTVQIGNFKVQIDPKASLMATPRGDLVRRFKRVQEGMGTARLPLASLDEDRPRRPVDPSLDTSRFVSRERLNRSFESRLGLRHGSVSSVPPKPLRDRPAEIEDDDDDDSET